MGGNKTSYTGFFYKHTQPQNRKILSTLLSMPKPQIWKILSTLLSIPPALNFKHFAKLALSQPIQSINQSINQSTNHLN